MTVLGPLFRYELTRLARRGLQPKLRALFAGLLLGMLLLLYLQAFRGVSPVRVLTDPDRVLPPGQAAEFAGDFVNWFLVVQVAVVVVVTPAVGAGAIAEEKERRSLDFLLSSPLTNWEVVAGKFAARLVFVGCVVLVGLPILCLTLFFGGVDPDRLLAGYAVTLTTAFALGAYSLFLAVRHDDLRGALLRAYLVVLGLSLFGFCCSCLHAPAYVSPFSTLLILLKGTPGFRSNGTVEPEVVAACYAGLHLPVGALFLALATRRLRRAAGAVPATRKPPAHEPRRGPDRPRVEWPVRRPGGWFVPALADGDDPLVWKERYFGGKLWPAPDSTARAVLNVCLIVGGPVLFYVIFALTTVSLTDGKFGALYRTLGQLVFGGLVPAAALGAGVLAAGAVARERERQTLVDLLMLPGDRRDVIRAKTIAAARAVLPLVYVLAGCFAAGVLAGGTSVVGLIAAPLVVVGWAAWGIGFGLWLSCRCRTSTRATGYFLAALLALLIVPGLFGELARKSFRDPASDAAWLAEAVFDGLSPAAGGWNALPDWRERDGGMPGVVAGLGAAVGGLAAAVAGWAFWHAAVRRFRDEGK